MDDARLKTLIPVGFQAAIVAALLGCWFLLSFASNTAILGFLEFPWTADLSLGLPLAGWLGLSAGATRWTSELGWSRPRETRVLGVAALTLASSVLALVIGEANGLWLSGAWSEGSIAGGVEALARWPELSGLRGQTGLGPPSLSQHSSLASLLVAPQVGFAVVKAWDREASRLAGSWSRLAGEVGLLLGLQLVVFGAVSILNLRQDFSVSDYGQSGMRILQLGFASCLALPLASLGTDRLVKRAAADRSEALAG